MNGGLGSPIGFYYGPVAYYATSLFRPLFPGDGEGWMPLGAAAGLALVGSGIAAYAWLRQSINGWAAFAGSLAYIASPYHVAVDLYVRGAIAELWAFVWMPLVLFFAGLSARRPAAGAAGVAVSYALLIMTHLPTTVLFSIVPLLYGLAMASDGKRLRTALVICGGLILGLGLTAIYLVPALTTQGFVHIERMRVGHLHYTENFLFGTLVWSSLIGRLSVAMTAMLGVALCAYAAAGSGALASLRRLRLAVALVSFALMTPISGPIWRSLPVLQAVQFPFRFGCVLTVALAALLGLAVASRGRKSKFALTARVAVAAGILAAGFCAAVTLRSVWRDAFPGAISTSDREHVEKRLAVARGSVEYFPRWAGPLDIDQLRALLARLTSPTGALIRVRASESGTRIGILDWKPRRIRVQFEAPRTAELTVSRFYYPGWTAGVDDRHDRLEVSPSTPDGLLKLTVPRGEHVLVLRLQPVFAERAGQVISVVSAALLVSGIFLCLRRGPEWSAV